MLVDVVGQSVGVGDGECVEGGFPAVHGGAFDESAWGFALTSGFAGFFGSLAGSFVFDVAYGEPEEFDVTAVSLGK